MKDFDEILERTEVVLEKKTDAGARKLAKLSFTAVRTDPPASCVKIKFRTSTQPPKPPYRWNAEIKGYAPG